MKDALFLAALALAGTAALVASARAGQAAMRWAIGRVILSFW